jgi:sodium transport system permease protein
MLRDKRVRSGALVSPLMMMLVLLFLFGFITDSLGKRENLKVHVIGSGPFVDQLKQAKMQVLTLKSVAEAEEKIRKGEVRVALEVPKEIVPGEQAVIKAYFDPKDEKAQVNVSQLGAVFEVANKKALEDLIVKQGLPKTAAEPVKFEEKPVKVGEAAGASDFIIRLLPYIIVVYAFFGGMGSVGDLVAGEKEKMTLETLLITAVSRLDVALGKFLALSLLCLASSMSAVAGMLLAGAFKLKMFQTLFPNGLGVTPMALFLTLLALLPAVALFSSLMLAVSTKAKNIREAQTQLTLLSLVVLMPAMFSQFIGLTDFAKAAWINAVPVLNTATAIRSALQGKVELGPLAIGVVVNGLLAAVALAWAIKLFKQEDVLVRV